MCQYGRYIVVAQDTKAESHRGGGMDVPSYLSIKWYQDPQLAIVRSLACLD